MARTTCTALLAALAVLLSGAPEGVRSFGPHDTICSYLNEHVPSVSVCSVWRGRSLKLRPCRVRTLEPPPLPLPLPSY